MDEECLKRNTDCVYFLASPFTCKKGADCEYRHSEMARLNPTDCWYWLSGSCLNPTCGYRHPPVDMAEAPDEVEPLPNSSSFPPSKNNVPCYFYSNGYCNRGDKCLFLHGPKDTSTSKQKILDAPPEDDRIPAKLLNGEPHTKIPIGKPCATTEPAPEKFPIAMRTTPKVACEDPVPYLKTQRYAYEPQEAYMITKSDSYQSDDVIRSEPSIYSDQCSDEKFDSGVQDEWWESSPEFDVLVKERSAQFDDQEYILDYEINNVGQGIQQHCYEDQQGMFLREPLYNSDINELDGDLREHLTNQRFLGERSAFRRVSTHRLHGRLEPKLERKSFSVPMQRSVFFAAKQRRQPWNLQLNNQRRGYYRHNKRQNVQRRVNSEASFTGSKNLGRSKSEKYRVKADATNSDNFEGPKPLSEILKGKVRSVGEGSNHGSSSA